MGYIEDGPRYWHGLDFQVCSNCGDGHRMYCAFCAEHGTFGPVQWLVERREHSAWTFIRAYDFKADAMRAARRQRRKHPGQRTRIRVGVPPASWPTDRRMTRRKRLRLRWEATFWE